MDIKEAFSEIGSYFGMALVVVGVIFITSGLISTPTNWTIILIGLGILIPILIFLIYLFTFASKMKKLIDQQYDTDLQEFKQRADKIIIVLDNANIQEKHQYQTNTIATVNAAAINEVSGYGHHNEETVKHTFCNVTFNVQYHNQELILTTTIPKGETAVRMYFYIQKETIAYIDPFDPENYHIDLTFIENETQEN